MKRIIAVLMVLVLVGCSTPEYAEPGIGGLTLVQVKTIVHKSVEQYEGHSKPVVKDTSWDETMGVDGHYTDLYEINSKYEWNGRLYDVWLVFELLPGQEYKLLRYRNKTTGTFLK